MYKVNNLFGVLVHSYITRNEKKNINGNLKCIYYAYRDINNCMKLVVLFNIECLL